MYDMTHSPLHADKIESFQKESQDCVPPYLQSAVPRGILWVLATLYHVMSCDIISFFSFRDVNMMHTDIMLTWCIHTSPNVVHPIADKAAQNLEILSENFQFSTSHTRIRTYHYFHVLGWTTHQSHWQNSGLLIFSGDPVAHYLQSPVCCDIIGMGWLP